MTDARTQANIFRLISNIDSALHDPKFMELVRQVGGKASSFRFYVKGSSAVRMQLSFNVPVPLTSDIDMVLLVDPTLPYSVYRALRALLIVRLLEVADAAVFHSAEFFVGRKTRGANDHQYSVREMNAPNKDDLPSYLDTVFSNSSIKVPTTAGLRYKFVNSLISPMGGGHEKIHISLLKFVPRLKHVDMDSILDIIIPTMDYKYVFDDWVASEDLVELNLYDKKVMTLNKYALHLDLNRSFATESRDEKLAARRQLLRELQFSMMNLV